MDYNIFLMGSMDNKGSSQLIHTLMHKYEAVDAIDHCVLSTKLEEVMYW